MDKGISITLMILFSLIILISLSYAIFYFMIDNKPIPFETSLNPNFMDFENIVVIFAYNDIPWEEDTIKSICYSDEVDSMKNVIKWFERESENHNQNLRPKLKCFEQPVKLPNEVLNSKGEICFQGGCNEQPFDTKKAILYLRENIDGITNEDILQVIYPVSESTPFYNHAITNLYSTFIFIKKHPESPFGLYGYSGKTVAHEITHIFGANDKYLEGGKPPCCKTNPQTGIEYLGEDIMCNIIVNDVGECTSTVFDKLEISEATAKEIGWLPKENN